MTEETQIDFPREKIAEFCKKWRILEFSLFGSILREDFQAESDIDVMVEFSPDSRHGLFNLVRMRDELRGILGRDVDIVSRGGIENSRNPVRRNAILSSAKVMHEQR